MSVYGDFFRPSAISGLVRLRRELSRYPGKSPDEICRLQSATYSNSGVDFEAAIQLHEIVPVLPNTVPEAFRCVISELVRADPPPWLGLLRRGRDALFSVISADVKACFERAGALEKIPNTVVVKWLDSLVSMAYAENDAKLLAQGREAEYLSFKLEQDRLAKHDTAPDVDWISLNNNSAGYDIQSWTFENSLFHPRLIEVKSSMRCPLRIVVTRHEWEVACRITDAYVFQVWHLPSGKMIEIGFREMSNHIPLDQGDGYWESATIEIATLDKS